MLCRRNEIQMVNLIFFAGAFLVFVKWINFIQAKVQYTTSFMPPNHYKRGPLSVDQGTNIWYDMDYLLKFTLKHVEYNFK